MYDVAFVTCAAAKLPGLHKAKDLYVGSFYTAARQTAQKIARRWLILSAKYGLLEPTRVVASYDMTLRNMSKGQYQQWVQDVRASLPKHVAPADRLVVLAGALYAEPFSAVPNEVAFPLKGLSMGWQRNMMLKLQNKEVAYG